MSADNTTAVRMARASLSAYSIESGITPLMASEIGYQSTPTVITDDDGIVAATIGVTTDGIIVAVRGTLPLSDVSFDQFAESVADWLSDVNSEMVPCPMGSGLAHAGWMRDAESIYRKMTDEIKVKCGFFPDKRVVFTGHSSGCD